MGYLALKRQLSRLQSKLSSQEGASITYALLLFLVCATVSSIILAAGTAASGRISKSVDSDRRYYAVTSAARLLKDVIEKYDIRIDRITSDSSDAEKKDIYYYSPRKQNSWQPYINADVLILTMDAAEYYTGIKEKNDESQPFKISVDDDTPVVTVQEKVDTKSGSITFYLKSDEGLAQNGADSTGSGTSGTGVGSGPAFTLTMDFVPTIKKSTRKKENKDNSGDAETITTEITTISWTLKSNIVEGYHDTTKEDSNDQGSGNT